MAVLPAYRGLRIASLLKRVQAQQAWREGIGVIHWTADPLQFPNAALNFGLLRAVAYEFAADLYPFRNDLNRVHASRLSLTWLVASRRVDDVPLVGSRAEMVDMSHRPQIARVNDGPRSADLARQEPLIAIEVPLDWTALQQEELERSAGLAAGDGRSAAALHWQRRGQVCDHERWCRRRAPFSARRTRIADVVAAVGATGVKTCSLRLSPPKPPPRCRDLQATQPRHLPAATAAATAAPSARRTGRRRSGGRRRTR